MVPRKQRKGTGATAGATAKAGKKAKGRSKLSQGKAKSTDKARKRAAAIIDPDLALVIKDPLRVQIVAIAHQRPISPSEFSREYDCTLGMASYQFRVLRDNDFIEMVDTVPVRGSTKHMYRATRRGFLSAADWAKFNEPIKADVSGAVLQDFNARVTQAMEAGTFYSRDDVVLFWLALSLDEISWPKLIEVLAWAISEAKELEVETVERRAKGEGDGCIPTTFAIAGFESPKENRRKSRGKRKRKPAPRKGADKGKRGKA